VSAVNKIVYGLAVAAVAAVAISYTVLGAKINARDAEIARLELRLSECGQRVTAADAAIEKQNAAIEAVRIDTVKIVERIDNIAIKYAVMRDTITKSVQEDLSCENSIKNIDYALRKFHGVGLRAEDGN
jgi:cell division protein FtsL